MKTAQEVIEVEPAVDVAATLDEEGQGLEMVEEPTDDQRELPLHSRIEALLIGSDRPLAEARLAEMVGLSGAGSMKALREAIDELNRQFQETGRVFRAERLAGGWQMLTMPEYGSLLAQLHRERQQSRLSQAALETLAIVAYRTKEGGVLRAEIEAIRGVACGEVLRTLMDRRLVKIIGRAEVLGRPMLYGVTREFLKVFGLSNLDDLPEVQGLPGSPAAKRKVVSEERKSGAEEMEGREGEVRSGERIDASGEGEETEAGDNGGS